MHPKHLIHACLALAATAALWGHQAAQQALSPQGAGGQNTWIVPSHDLVIVRMGHMRGQGPARRATNTALGLVIEAVNSKRRP
jgi:CubicO group peptidase (beta-lactamase class C family)